MDILYVIGQGSRWQDNELRYSLRSLCKYGRNVGRIFIAGYLPVFINPESVTYIKCRDEYKAKHHNILRCIEKAVETAPISSEFLYSSDDHFYIKETDFDHYPYYLRPGEDKLLPSRYEKDEKHNSYRSSLISTHQLLSSHNLPVYRFSWHGNTHFNRKLFNAPLMKQMRRESYGYEYGCEPTCMMLNYQYSVKPFDITLRSDLKFQTLRSDKEGFMDRIGDRECFSIGDGSLGKYPIEVLQKLFPHPSRYERF